MIIVEFRFDRWEVIRRYGYRETLIAHRPTKEAADAVASVYRAEEGR